MPRSKCHADDCENLAAKRGLCSKHLREAMKGRRDLPPRITVQARAEQEYCTAPGCASITEAKGLCSKHYQRSRRGYQSDSQAFSNRRKFKYGPTCTVENCDVKHLSRGYCANHYYRWRHHIALDSEVRIKRTADDCRFRDDLGRKQCVRCSEWFPPDTFTTSRKSPDGLSSYCAACTSVKNRSNRLMSNYKLTPETLKEMLVVQNNSCAICSSPVEFSSVQIDHDHACCPGKSTCGKCVRGLLCSSCNTGIGLLKDSSATLKAAIQYLESSPYRRSTAS